VANPSTSVAQLTTLILSWLDDESAGYFTASNTITWINFAQREVQKQLVMAGENYYVKPIETLTVVGQADYVLPSDFLKEHRLEIVISGTGSNEIRQPLSAITINEQDLVSIAPGQPTNYYLKKDRITISPTPSVANQVMRMWYSYKILDVALTTDIPDIPEEYMEYVALLAAYNGFIKDDRPPENLVLKANEYKERLKQMAEDRLQDSSRHVVMTEDYGYGGWF
jgi:hypothetical protein